MIDKAFTIYFTWCKVMSLKPSHYSTLKAFIKWANIQNITI